MRKLARSDEEFVKDAIIKYVGEFNATRGEDPPDYYIGEGQNKIALEITRLPPFGGRFTSDKALDRLCERLDDEFRNRIDAGTSILLKINSPIGRLRKFAKGLRTLISNSLNNNSLSTEWKTFLINGESIELAIINHGIVNKKRIVGLKISKGLSLVTIQAKLDKMMSDSLKVKSQKLKKFLGEKWLGFYNDTIFADENNFRLSIENGNLVHDFSKIFLVGRDGKVNLIFTI